MKRITFAVVAALAAASLIGSGVHAQSASPQPVQPLGTFTVTFDCESFAPNPTVFTFEGAVVSAACGSGGAGMAVAEFQAPATAGTYTGIANPCGPPALRPAGIRFTQTQCEFPFDVVVAGEAVTTTTIAVPVTTAVAAVPPAPTAAAPAALPATGSGRTAGGIAIALALLAIGGGLVAAARWRKDPASS